MAKSLAQAVTDARERLGLTRAAVARAAQIDPGELARIETGERLNPSFAVACRIAVALGLSADDLAVRSGIIKRSPTSKSKPRASSADTLAALDSVESALRRALKSVDIGRKRLERNG